MSLVLAALLWLAVTDVLGFGSDAGIVQVTVQEDFTIDDIADLLYENGLIKYKSLFKFYSGFSDAEEKIEPGTYELNLNFDYRAVVDGMSSRGTRVTIDVTFPEGYTMLQIFERLDEEGVCAADEMWEAADTDFDYDFLKGLPLGDYHRLEGFLFPDTHTFYIGDSPIRVLKKLLDNFNNRFKEEYYEQAEELGYSVHEIITVASMIEREAKTDDDRPLIASVIYNRLGSDSYPRLEIDATIWYAIAETGEAFSTSLNSPYNTYMAEGLPPGPISNPGLKSIQAALSPDDTDYYFYALRHDGSHKFSKTFEEHREFVSSDEYGG
ncbi:MAG: endolytic transglycosylase MltG [Clostridiales bacterium]|nr:endolytic transglycosylase MltG [Clostridiales bacterium]